MKRLITVSALALMMMSLAFVSASSRAATFEDDGAQAVDPQTIVRAFTRKETEFRRALNNYTFKREAVVQTIGFGGQITGEYARTSQFTFNDAGERFERITFFPMPTLPEISFTQEHL